MAHVERIICSAAENLRRVPAKLLDTFREVETALLLPTFNKITLFCKRDDVTKIILEDQTYVVDPYDVDVDYNRFRQKIIFYRENNMELYAHLFSWLSCLLENNRQINTLFLHIFDDNLCEMASKLVSIPNQIRTLLLSSTRLLEENFVKNLYNIENLHLLYYGGKYILTLDHAILIDKYFNKLTRLEAYLDNNITDNELVDICGHISDNNEILVRFITNAMTIDRMLDILRDRLDENTVLVNVDGLAYLRIPLRPPLIKPAKSNR
jgi:hypothetical protein